LVKLLVELHGGEIALESKEGVGSTFSILFPITKVDESSIEPTLIEIVDNRLIKAAEIEFSDVFM
ncbi:PAS domain-containing sensor histidine kinase, partial [Armatimonadetes bacterium]|nr:PAS domain-containing sensor histidine kinase [bacterium]